MDIRFLPLFRQQSFSNLLPVNRKWAPGLADRHNFQAVDIYVRRQAGHPTDYFSNIIAGKRLGAAIHLGCPLCITLKSDERELGIGQAGFYIGHPDWRTEKIRTEVPGKLFNE